MEDFDNTIVINEDKYKLILEIIKFQNQQLKKNIDRYLKK